MPLLPYAARLLTGAVDVARATVLVPVRVARLLSAAEQTVTELGITVARVGALLDEVAQVPARLGGLLDDLDALPSTVTGLLSQLQPLPERVLGLLGDLDPLPERVLGLLGDLDPLPQRVLGLLGDLEPLPPRAQALLAELGPVGDLVTALLAEVGVVPAQVAVVTAGAQELLGDLAGVTDRATDLLTRVAPAVAALDDTALVALLQDGGALLHGVRALDPGLLNDAARSLHALPGVLGRLDAEVMPAVASLEGLVPVVAALRTTVDQLDQVVVGVAALLTGIPGSARLLKRGTKAVPPAG